jgi:hypothetical protein
MPVLVHVLICLPRLFKREDFINDRMDLECGKDAVHIFKSMRGIGEFREDLITGQLSVKIKEERQTHCVFDPTCTPCKLSDFWMIGITILPVSAVSASCIYVEIKCESSYEGERKREVERRKKKDAPHPVSRQHAYIRHT